MVTFGSVMDKKVYPLMEKGDYVLTLNELEEVEGQYGQRLVWKFLVALPSHPTDYIARDDGEEKTLWGFTDCDIVVGSLAHQFAEALTGRTLTKDTAPPTEEELIGKRLLAFIGHETPTRGKSAGVPREMITVGTIRRFNIPVATAAKATNGVLSGVERTAAPADVDRDLTVSKLKKQVARLLKLDPENGKKAEAALAASDLETAPLAELEALSSQVGEAITAALDA